MELVLTDKGRMELESGTLEDDQSTWPMGRWLIGIEEGVIGSGENSFNSWQEFKIWYGEFGYRLTGKLLKGGYITVEDIPELG